MRFGVVGLRLCVRFWRDGFIFLRAKARAWVCGLIQKHEGRLEVSSQPGKVARFGFAFP